MKCTRRCLGRLVTMGVALMVTLLIWGCVTLPPMKESSEGGYVRLPFVRVLLENDLPDLTVDGTSSFAVECKRGDKSVVYYSSQPVTINQDRGRLLISLGHDNKDERFDEVVMMPRSNKGYLSYNKKRFRGMFRVMPHGLNLRLINILHMDDYLKGVVPPEMGKVGDSDLEAIKAQAVAARTYSMGHLSQYADEPYDMKSDVADQLYEGVEVEIPLIDEAIELTRGYVVKFQDKLINAYYHSTCGGYTDDIEEIWDKPAAPYLRAVDDSGACSWSKYYHWKESYTAGQLKLRIEQYLSAERGREIRLDDLTDITVTARTAGGRVAGLVVKTKAKSYTFGKDRVRWVFKRSSNPELILQSDRFKVHAERDDAGRLVTIEFDGGGYGHGVGMCQCGAMGMARNGRKFDKILTFYYQNTQLVKLY